MTNRSSHPPPSLAPEAKLDVRVQQAPLPFAQSSLPRTMALALRYRDQLERLLDAATVGYPFEDRVLLTLAPYWRPDIESFHDGGGSSLQQAHDPHKLERFDQHYFEELERLLAANS